MSEHELNCALCGKEYGKTKDEQMDDPFIVANGVALCGTCVYQSKELLQLGWAEEAAKESSKSLKKPSELKEHLDKHAIGQHEAKKTLAVTIYNHYKRLILNTLGGVKIKKNNVLIFGGTGCGKTYLLQLLAKELDIPLVIVDSSKFTKAGYVGQDVEVSLQKLFKASGKNIEKAQKGIVLFDEFDKFVNKQESSAIDDLLKIVEGSLIDVPLKGSQIGDRTLEQTVIQLDTSEILFIGCGAFTGLKDQVVKKNSKAKSIGFSDLAVDHDKEHFDTNWYSYITNDDLLHYGFSIELLGRFPIKVPVSVLTKEELKKILTELDDSVLNQAKSLLAFDGINLTFSDDAIDYYIEQAQKEKTGARSLPAIIEKTLMELTYQALEDGSTELNVTRVLLEGSKPKLLESN